MSFSIYNYSLIFYYLIKIIKKIFINFWQTLIIYNIYILKKIVNMT
jgi:hypothetical protein